VPTPAEQPEDSPEAKDRAKRRALATVAFTLFLDLAGFGIILPILPYYAESMHASATMVALLSTAFSAAQFLMAPVLGRISDRYGRRPVMLVSIAGSVAAALVLGFAHVLWLVFVARIVAGSSKANVSTAHAYVADLIAPDQRAKYMGMMGAAMGMGFIFGPAIGGLLATDELPALPFFVSAALSFVNLIMAAIWLPETHFPGKASATAGLADAAGASQLQARAALLSSAGLRRAIDGLRGTPMAWLAAIAFCFYLSFAGMESTMALLSERLFAWGGRETGLFMTFIGVNMVVFQGVVVGRAVARWGEARVLALGLVMLAFGMASLGLVGHLTGWLGLPLTNPAGGASIYALGMYGLGGALLSGGNGLTNATLSALVSRVSTAEEQGWNMGIKESAASLARVGGPIIAGPLFQHVDPGAPMIVGGLIALVNVRIAVGLRARLRRDAAKPDRDPDDGEAALV
jgi:MFS transporter, DHA1 family, tetracycline resistance protein